MSTPDVTRSVVRNGGRCTYNIAVSGPLDVSAASSLRCLLGDLERERVTIDLTECAAITDGALTSLVAASRIAEAHGGEVCLEPVGCLQQD